MKFNKLISILIILSSFAGFTYFEIHRKADKAVLNIINAAEIEVERNNKTSEVICIPDVKIFTTDLTQSYLPQNKRLSFEDSIKMGYLTQNFAEDVLSNKRVKLKYTGKENQNCKYADIIIKKIS